MEIWLEYMKVAGIFLIIAELILHLVPSAEYEKYVRYLLDLSVVIVLFWPLLNEESRADLLDSVAQMSDYEEEWKLSVETLSFNELYSSNPDRIGQIVQAYEESNRVEGSVSDGKVMEETTGE